MKKNSTKRSFDKFTKRSKAKRRQKDRAIKELKKAVASVNSQYGDVKFSDALNLGRRKRSGYSAHGHYREEIVSEGSFTSSKSGFGFVSVPDFEKDIFIPEGKCAEAIDGDTVEISYHTYTSGGEVRTEGVVKKIKKVGRKTLVGTVVRMPVSRRDRYLANKFSLMPDEPRVLVRPFITEIASATEGDKVEAVIDRDASGRVIGARVIRVFGEASSREANYEAILEGSGITVEFSKEELEEAQRVSSEKISYEGRALFDNDVIFTIDGADAKDLDDAVSLKRLPGGRYRLGVHIADVSHYVTEKTPLDRAVMSRGTSVYFTDKVVPMLPTALSNGACSLNSGEDKYAISAVIDLSASGEIEKTKLVPSVIKSAVRGVYSEVNEILSGTASKEIKGKYKPVISSLRRMEELYLVLKARSDERGAVDFDAAEAKILLDSEGEPCDIIRRQRGVSERIIEQFMIVANEAVATELKKKGIPCVFRTHAEPPPEKLEDFLTFVYNIGIKIPKRAAEGVSVKDFSSILKAASEKGVLAPVSYSMLRSMAKAEYSKVCSGHFGLGLKNYCHFTSPIRRLSDLATHRVIRRVLFEGKNPSQYESYVGRAAAAATDAEIRAMEAERKIENLYKVIYMSRFVGEEFDAVISSVTSFGAFCMLENTCEGLVPISTLPGMFIYDERAVALRSADITLRLGDEVRVRLSEADIIQGKLRFELI